MARSTYSADFKAKIVIEVLEVRKAPEAITAENQTNPNMLRNRKAEFLKKASKAFESQNKATKEAWRRRSRKKHGLSCRSI